MKKRAKSKVLPNPKSKVLPNPTHPKQILAHDISNDRWVARIIKRFHPNLFTEFLLAIFTSLLTFLVGAMRMGFGNLNLRFPIIYGEDPLQLANLVENVQQGHWGFSNTLGGPLGQQLGLSAYGIEWPGAIITSLFAGTSHNIWLGINLYFLLSFPFVAFCTYIGARLINLNRVAAILVSVAFALIPVHEMAMYWINLANYASIPIIVGIAVRLAQGSTFRDIIQCTNCSNSKKYSPKLSIALVAFGIIISAGGDQYFMWFNFFVLSLLSVILFTRKEFWERSRRLCYVALFQLLLIFLVAIPIIWGRIGNGLGMSEPSTGDRRPFAALADGGELFSMFISGQNSVSHHFLNGFPRFASFFSEYYASSVISDPGYQGGIVVLIAFLALLAASFGILIKGNFFKKFDNFSPSLGPVLMVFGVAIALYLKGGLGTFIAFVFPSLRVYARMILFITLCSLLILGLIVSAKGVVKTWIRVFTLIVLISVLIDSTSGLLPLPISNATNNDTYVQSVGSEHFNALTLRGTTRVVATAVAQLPAGCTVLELPATTFPVDFQVGIVSWGTYETLKPGLINSPIKWTSGAIPGTPNGKINDELISLFREKKYETMLEVAEKNNICGTLFFPSLQSAIQLATQSMGVKYDAPQVITQFLQSHYGKSCFATKDDTVALYCRRATVSK